MPVIGTVAFCKSSLQRFRFFIWRRHRQHTCAHIFNSDNDYCGRNIWWWDFRIVVGDWYRGGTSSWNLASGSQRSEYRGSGAEGSRTHYKKYRR